MRFTTDLANESEVPYFLWDEPMSVRELRSRLGGAALSERIRLSGKVMREARVDDALRLVPVSFIVEHRAEMRSSVTSGDGEGSGSSSCESGVTSASFTRPDLLSPLQRRILSAVSRHLPGLFLSGGTALGAVYLGHRRSADVDLFTRRVEEYESLAQQFEVLIHREGLQSTAVTTVPGFRRVVVSDGNEEVPVDLVLDTAPAVAEAVTLDDGLEVDSLRDIAANKLCAILGRAEVRDYVDLYFLERSGIDLLDLLPLAQGKDGGLEPATLAFVLADVHVGADPGGLAQPISAGELQAFIDDLRRRLARRAFPGTD